MFDVIKQIYIFFWHKNKKATGNCINSCRLTFAINCLYKKQIRALRRLAKSSDNVALVRWKGLEPLTPWFVVKYSIQLSYQRITLYYITIRKAFCQGLFWIFLNLYIIFCHIILKEIFKIQSILNINPLIYLIGRIVGIIYCIYPY